MYVQICTEDHAAVAAVGSPGGKPRLLDNKVRVCVCVCVCVFGVPVLDQSVGV